MDDETHRQRMAAHGVGRAVFGASAMGLIRLHQYQKPSEDTVLLTTPHELWMQSEAKHRMLANSLLAGFDSGFRDAEQTCNALARLPGDARALQRSSSDGLSPKETFEKWTQDAADGMRLDAYFSDAVDLVSSLRLPHDGNHRAGDVSPSSAGLAFRNCSTTRAVLGSVILSQSGNTLAHVFALVGAADVLGQAIDRLVEWQRSARKMERAAKLLIVNGLLSTSFRGAKVPVSAKLAKELSTATVVDAGIRTRRDDALEATTRARDTAANAVLATQAALTLLAAQSPEEARAAFFVSASPPSSGKRRLAGDVRSKSAGSLGGAEPASPGQLAGGSLEKLDSGPSPRALLHKPHNSFYIPNIMDALAEAEEGMEEPSPAIEHPLSSGAASAFTSPPQPGRRRFDPKDWPVPDVQFWTPALEGAIVPSEGPSPLDVVADVVAWVESSQDDADALAAAGRPEPAFPSNLVPASFRAALAVGPPFAGGRARNGSGTALGSDVANLDDVRSTDFTALPEGRASSAGDPTPRAARDADSVGPSAAAGSPAAGAAAVATGAAAGERRGPEETEMPSDAAKPAHPRPIGVRGLGPTGPLVPGGERASAGGATSTGGRSLDDIIGLVSSSAGKVAEESGELKAALQGTSEAAGGGLGRAWWANGEHPAAALLGRLSATGVSVLAMAAAGGSGPATRFAGERGPATVRTASGTARTLTSLCPSAGPAAGLSPAHIAAVLGNPDSLVALASLGVPLDEPAALSRCTPLQLAAAGLSGWTVRRILNGELRSRSAARRAAAESGATGSVGGSEAEDDEVLRQAEALRARRRGLSGAREAWEAPALPSQAAVANLLRKAREMRRQAVADAGAAALAGTEGSNLLLEVDRAVDDGLSTVLPWLYADGATSRPKAEDAGGRTAGSAGAAGGAPVLDRSGLLLTRRDALCLLAAQWRPARPADELATLVGFLGPAADTMWADDAQALSDPREDKSLVMVLSEALGRHRAAARAFRSIVEGEAVRRVSHGGDIELFDEDGPAHQGESAASGGDVSGMTPAELALSRRAALLDAASEHSWREWGRCRAAAVLLRHGARVGGSDRALATPLQWSVLSGSVAVACLLLGNGAHATPGCATVPGSLSWLAAHSACPALVLLALRVEADEDDPAATRLLCENAGKEALLAVAPETDDLDCLVRVVAAAPARQAPDDAADLAASVIASHPDASDGDLFTQAHRRSLADRCHGPAGHEAAARRAASILVLLGRRPFATDEDTAALAHRPGTVLAGCAHAPAAEWPWHPETDPASSATLPVSYAEATAAVDGTAVSVPGAPAGVPLPASDLPRGEASRVAKAARDVVLRAASRLDGAMAVALQVCRPDAEPSAAAAARLSASGLDTAARWCGSGLCEAPDATMADASESAAGRRGPDYEEWLPLESQGWRDAVSSGGWKFWTRDEAQGLSREALVAASALQGVTAAEAAEAPAEAAHAALRWLRASWSVLSGHEMVSGMHTASGAANRQWLWVFSAAAAATDTREAGDVPYLPPEERNKAGEDAAVWDTAHPPDREATTLAARASRGVDVSGATTKLARLLGLSPGGMAAATDTERAVMWRISVLRANGLLRAPASAAEAVKGDTPASRTLRGRSLCAGSAPPAKTWTEQSGTPPDSTGRSGCDSGVCSVQ